MSSFPDYYALLNVSKTATHEEIRTAYKRESLRTHPDRLSNATPVERQRATEKFQVVADAYYVLSDTSRRREYDQLHSRRSPFQEKPDDPASSSNFFSNFSNMFTGSGAAAEERPDADNQFANIFEELLRPEVERHAPWWAWFGGVCGAGLGFVVGNVPGLMLGAYAGNKLGAIRDAKGRSVAAVFGELGNNQKAEILRALALKVLGSAM